MDSPPGSTESLGPEIPDDRLWTEHRPGTVLADRYTIVRRVGSGGYATVYLAEDDLLRRRVALKVLHPSRIAGHGLQRLRREVLVAREVRSPYLAEVHDLVVADGVAFLSMEWVDGESLEERLDREGPLPVDEVVRIGRKILSGLDALHRRGILHRDVKPSNILLAPDGSVKLVDFGLALRWEGGHTRITATEAVVGTKEYLSPEQILGKEIGPETDLYAFGATLYEMVTGEPAFGKGTSFQTILSRLERGPRRPSTVRPEVPDWLDRVIFRLLERRPRDRYRSVPEVAGELESRSSTWITPRRKRQGLKGLVIAAILLAAAALLWVRYEGSRPRFSHVARLAGPRGIQALATDGSVLWTRPDLWGPLAPARLRPEEPERLVGLLTLVDDPWNPEFYRRLHILDPETGRRLRSVDLPAIGSYAFPDFSDRYGSRQLKVRDLDGDGFDEVLATLSHAYWPSYTVLYEPRIERVRTLFLGGGHHNPEAFVDVTGDGREEALFFGWANRLGYLMGLGAVAIEPWINEKPDRNPARPAHTPDHYLARLPNDTLLWYEILPHDACYGDRFDCLRAGEDGFRIPRKHGNEVRLDLSGFRVGTVSELSPRDRQRQRSRAYDLAAEARLLRHSAGPERALDAALRSVETARRVVDPGLEEYTGRIAAILLARNGRFEEAEERFDRLYRASEIPPNVAFDAAEIFHLEGDLDRAVGWYRKVFHTNPAGYSGRPRHESLTGLALARVERGELDEGLTEIRRLSPASKADRKRESSLENLFAWLSGVEIPPPKLSSKHPDLVRYLTLETSLGTGHPPDEILPLVREDLERASVTRGLLLALESELLRRRGSPEDALLRARKALEIALSERDEVVHYRTFTPLVAARLAAALEDLGRDAEARRIRDWHVPEEDVLVARGVEASRAPAGLAR